MAGLLAFGDSLPVRGNWDQRGRLSWPRNPDASSARQGSRLGGCRRGLASHRAGPRRSLGDAATGELPLTSGDKDRAAEGPVGAASAIGSRLGSEASGRRRRTRSPAVGGFRSMPGDTPMSHRQFGLTQREREVLRLVAEGNRNDQIARDALHLPEDSERARLSHPRQAGCLEPDGGDRSRTSRGPTGGTVIVQDACRVATTAGLSTKPCTRLCTSWATSPRASRDVANIYCHATSRTRRVLRRGARTRASHALRPWHVKEHISAGGKRTRAIHRSMMPRALKNAPGIQAQDDG